MAEKGDGISFNKEEFSRFFKRYGIILLLLIPIFLSVWFRAYTYNLPITDDWAEQAVHANIKDSIRSEIDSKYPDLLSENKEILIEKEFQKTLEAQKAEIKLQVNQASEYFKSKLQDERGKTYLLEMDPYFWYTYAKNYEETGMLGDKI